MNGKCKCLKYKHFLSLDSFRIKRNGELTKTCIKCLDAGKALRERAKCPHGRRRDQCKDCGGIHICEHERVRVYCKDCSGGRYCYMKGDCGGSQICPHQKERPKCKECGGSQICPHQRVRSTCRDYRGGSICSEHGRRRSECKECDGGNICHHQKHRAIFPICNPTGHLAGGPLPPHKFKIRGNTLTKSCIACLAKAKERRAVANRDIEDVKMDPLAIDREIGGVNRMKTT
ncbi:uncharacterized protein LOC130621274 [Hydractinia symbiolongicarpus]|uniref:uncharacterized protein LOC130621274 n=1 Tax=Hydractinia symbiolongicarpus TaxID=13093 RepID=UPI00254C0287|nr:uncharacterized protein LOC130621274 [Hydractinia symbiolongicarpus]